jgi:hypothetical protein
MEINGRKYITLKEWAEARNLDPVLIRQRAQRGTALEGMTKVGRDWMIPEDAELEDKRIVSGKYIGQKRKRG